MNTADMTPAVIGLASNTDDAAGQLEEAVEELRDILREVHVSEFYQSPSVSGDGSNYTNAVLSGLTDRSRDDIAAHLKKLEIRHGRDEKARSEKRVPLDLDLVIWDGRIERENDFEEPYFNRGYRQLLADGAFQYQV